MKKRILTWLLAISMLGSLLTVPAGAAAVINGEGHGLAIVGAGGEQRFVVAEEQNAEIPQLRQARKQRRDHLRVQAADGFQLFVQVAGVGHLVRGFHMNGGEIVAVFQRVQRRVHLALIVGVQVAVGSLHMRGF